MNIVYATRAAIPYPSAASINTVQMCEGLSRLGHSVTLAVGWKFWRRRWRGGTIWDYYGVEPRFQVQRFFELPKTRFFFDGRVQRLVRERDALLYLRYPRLLTRALAQRMRTILELHAPPAADQFPLIDRALRSETLLKLVVITESLRRHLLLHLRAGDAPSKIVVAPDAVNVRRFRPCFAASPNGAATVGYVGSLYPGKGMEVILPVARRLPDTVFLVYGGGAKDRTRWNREKHETANLHLRGAVAPHDVPRCMDEFEIALLPNQPAVRIPGGADIGRFTSPLKLFEYMAAGKAIIASDLANLREVLVHEKNCLLVDHSDANAWAHAIRRLQDDARLRRRIGTQARHDAEQEYSYENRFRKIFESLESPHEPESAGSRATDEPEPGNRQRTTGT